MDRFALRIPGHPICGSANEHVTEGSLSSCELAVGSLRRSEVLSGVRRVTAAFTGDSEPGLYIRRKARSWTTSSRRS